MRITLINGGRGGSSFINYLSKNKNIDELNKIAKNNNSILDKGMYTKE